MSIYIYTEVLVTTTIFKFLWWFYGFHKKPLKKYKLDVLILLVPGLAGTRNKTVTIKFIWYLWRGIDRDSNYCLINNHSSTII